MSYGRESIKVISKHIYLIFIFLHWLSDTMYFVVVGYKSAGSLVGHETTA
jgi:hypothetical protein